MFEFVNIQIKTVTATRHQAICSARSYIDSRRWRKLMLGHDGPSEVIDYYHSYCGEGIQHEKEAMPGLFDA